MPDWHSFEAVQPSSSMDIRWLQSVIGVKGSVLTFKASKNLGQTFRKADSSFMTFEASTISDSGGGRRGGHRITESQNIRDWKGPLWVI